MTPWRPDPRETTCKQGYAGRGSHHTYRDQVILGAPYTQLRCIHCGRVKGRRYPKGDRNG